MNTRLQVEHPVTEEITGQDLVEWQLRVASGEGLPKRQGELSIRGWAMEARLYAEDPAKGFLPSIGKLEHLHFPEGARIESGVIEGGTVTPFYDPMIAKIIVHGDDRETAAHKLAAAVGEVQVFPVRTNAGFLARLAAASDFIAGRVDTGFIERHLDTLTGDEAEPSVTAAALSWRLEEFMDADFARGRPLSPWANAPSGLFGFRLNADSAPASLPFRSEGQPHLAVVRPDKTGPAAGQWRWDITLDGKAFKSDDSPWPGAHGDSPGRDGSIFLFRKGEAYRFTFGADIGASGAMSAGGSILAPMPGRIVSVEVEEGAAVSAGQRLLVLEAMKMEQALVAPFDGVVAELKAVAGAQVPEGMLLARIESREA
jgi:propionyl-CoA carboxylase alpha chain/3-methylcrotonyl-CoA carboxylase alpha subunit